MPSLYQLSNVMRKRRDQRSNSVQHLVEEGNTRRNQSVKPSQDSPLSDTSGFGSSPVSTTFSREEIEVKNWSPRIIDAPRFDRPSLTPEMAEAVREYHIGKVEERRASCVDSRSRQQTEWCREGVEVKHHIKGAKNWSPRYVDAPRFERPSLTPDQAQAIKEYHMGKVEERRASVMDSRYRGQTDLCGLGVEAKHDLESSKNWSPRLIDAPRFERPSLTPDQAQAIKEYHMGKAEERKASLVAGRDKGLTTLSQLKTRPELGYSCKIEGSSSHRLAE